MRRLQLGPVAIDLDARRVQRPGAADARLTPTEHRLLVYLLEADGAAMDQADILRDVWGYRTLDTRTLPTTMRRLRRKVEPDPDAPAHLLTVPGVGYRLQLDTIAASVEAPPGRRAELDATLSALLTHRLVTLTGPPGSGTSTVGRAAAAQLGAHRVAPSATDLHAGVARALGWPVATPDAETVADLLQRAGPVHLWLDDLVACPPSLAALLDAVPSLRVLACAPQPLGLPDEVTVVCLGLPEADALAALGDTPPAVGQAIAAAVDRLPLGLALAASWIPLLGPEEVLRQLREGQLDVLAAGPRLHDLLTRALERLDADSRATLRALCAFADGATAADLAAVRPGSSTCLGRLVACHLVHRDGGRFRPLATVARHVRLHEPRDHDAPYVAFLASLGSAEALHRADAEGDPDAAATLARLRPDLAQVSAFAPNPRDALACAEAVCASSAWAGGRDEALALLEALPDLPSAARGRAAAAAARLLRTTGHGPRALRRLEALDLGAIHGDDRALVELERAFVLRGLSRFDDARAAIEIGLEHATPGSDVRGELYHSRSIVESVTGHPDAAEADLRKALAVHEAAGRSRRLAFVLLRSAILESALGRDPIGSLDLARAHVERLDSTYARATLAQTEALLASRIPDYPAAFDHYTDAAQLYRELGDHEAVTRMELSAAACSINYGELDPVWSLCSAALPVVRVRGDQQAEAQALFLLGEVQIRRGRHAEALRYLEPALALATPFLREQIAERIARTQKQDPLD